MGILLVFSALKVAQAQDVQLNEVMTSNSDYFTPISEESFDYVEFYNSSAAEVDLSTTYLTDDITVPMKWQFPSGTIIAPESYLMVWMAGDEASNTSPNELQANFRLNSNGESVYMFSDALELLDSAPDWELQHNSSLGRITGNETWYYLTEPSPNQINLAENAVNELAQFPMLTHQGGIYTESFLWDYTPDNADDVIYYTLDGSTPTIESDILQNAFLINDNVVIKLLVTRENALASTVLAHTYIVDPELDLDVISLTTAEENFFGPGGIYANPYSDLEKEANLEYFVNGESVVNQNVGVKIHAPDGRDQKSLRLYARSEYGDNDIDYQIFPNKPIDSFRRLVLRNGGNDGVEIGESHFRDVMSHELYLESNHTNGMSAHVRVNVFINGAYWGIYNLRERQDIHYMKSNYGYEPEEVDFLEFDFQEPGYQKIHSGNWNNWDELEEFVINEDLAEEANYALVADWVDIDNFIDYQAFQIIIGNQDWCNNNVKLWRPYVNGKWKWIMWDVEYGLGTFEDFPIGDPSFNFLGMAISWCGWGNSDYSWLFRNLLENEEFKTKYITRTQDILNTSFKPSHVASKTVEHSESMQLDIDKQFDTWGSNLNNWQSSVDDLLSYTADRPAFHLDNISTQFEFEGDRSLVNIDISDSEAGEIKLNTIVLNDETIGVEESTFPWTGIYYDVQLISLEALAYTGYEFSHWEGDIDSEEPILELILTQNLDLTAVYEPSDVTPITYDGLVINELLSQNSSVFPDELGEFEDWIELYNESSEPLNLSNLYLSDDSEDLLKFQIPDDAPELTLAPDAHIIFFADNDTEQGNKHTNFSLDASGEELYVSFINDLDEIETIDQISFNALEENQSYGRETDAASDWITFNIPTPEAENEIIIIDNISEARSPKMDLTLYPNPTSGSLQLLSTHLDYLKIQTLSIYSLDGKLVREFNTYQKHQLLDVSDLHKGVYLLQITDTNSKIMVSERFVKW
ncbi:MAG: CotH kinase family protein [Flavobacteriales bacterium]